MVYKVVVVFSISRSYFATQKKVFKSDRRVKQLLFDSCSINFRVLYLVAILVGQVDELTDFCNVTAAVLHADDVGMSAQVNHDVHWKINAGEQDIYITCGSNSSQLRL